MARIVIPDKVSRCQDRDRQPRLPALDLPSGLDATTGETPGAVIHPQRTVTLALPKTGLASVSGAVYLADIGIPPEVYEEMGLSFPCRFRDDTSFRLRSLEAVTSLDKLNWAQILQWMLNYKEREGTFILEALKALSHPTRMRIFDMLMEGVQCSCEISEALDLAPNLISYHMRALEEAGLVQSERDAEDARWIYYSVRCPMLERLRGQLSAFLDPERIQPRQPSCGPRSGGACAR